jgi:hypothetical protein
MDELDRTEEKSEEKRLLCTEIVLQMRAVLGEK